MNRSIVIDTNIIVALLDKRDVHHKKASNIVERLENEEKDPLLMDCILNETYTVLARRSLERGYRFSEIVDKVKSDLESFEAIQAYPLVSKLHDRVVDLMIRTDGRLNYHDALISIVMKEKGIEEIATLDEDFNLKNFRSLYPRSLITRLKIIKKISTFLSNCRKGIFPESFCISTPFL